MKLVRSVGSMAIKSDGMSREPCVRCPHAKKSQGGKVSSRNRAMFIETGGNLPDVSLVRPRMVMTRPDPQADCNWREDVDSTKCSIWASKASSVTGRNIDAESEAGVQAPNPIADRIQ